ncbi:MAG: phosphate ABC transporter permease PstA [Formosimonas sp.]
MMNQALYVRRRRTNAIMLTLTAISVVIGLVWLVWILWSLLSKGLPALSASLFLENQPTMGEVGGGLKNAIVGSLLMVLTATAMATPVGILAGTYLAEYGRNNRFTRVVRFVNDILLSAPSITIGMFAFILFYFGLKMGANANSGWSGSIALAIVMLPVVVRTTDDMLKLVPNSLREAAVALGCPYWKMIFTICYRSAQTGMITGLLLGVARIFGETAPLIVTAVGNNFFSTDMSQRMASLPKVILDFALSPDENWQKLAWGGAMLITFFVLLINITTRAIANRKT